MLYSEIRYYLSIAILALSAYLIFQVYIKPSEMDSSDVLGAFINSIEAHTPIEAKEVCFSIPRIINDIHAHDRHRDSTYK